MSQKTKEVIGDIFDVIRFEKGSNPEKLKKVVSYVRQNNLTLPQITKKIVEDNRTGWKEVVSNISKLSGHSFDELGLSPKDTDRILKKNLGANTTSESQKRVWFALHKKVGDEMSQVKDHATGVSFSNEPNNTPKLC